MSCPYPDELLEYWDSVANPMGSECADCKEWDCEHNDNDDNPNRWDAYDNPFSP
jgi:hypothetical protein